MSKNRRNLMITTEIHSGLSTAITILAFMRKDIDKYYIPKSFIRKEMRHKFIMGFIIGVGTMILIGVILIHIFQP